MPSLGENLEKSQPGTRSEGRRTGKLYQIVGSTQLTNYGVLIQIQFGAHAKFQQASKLVFLVWLVKSKRKCGIVVRMERSPSMATGPWVH